MVTRAPIEIVRVDDTLVALRTLRSPDHDDLFGMLIGKRTNEHGVDDGEDRRVGADAEGEREGGDDGERRPPSEGANGETKILKQDVHVVPRVRRGKRKS